MCRLFGVTVLSPLAPFNLLLASWTSCFSGGLGHRSWSVPSRHQRGGKFRLPAPAVLPPHLALHRSPILAACCPALEAPRAWFHHSTFSSLVAAELKTVPSSKVHALFQPSPLCYSCKSLRQKRNETLFPQSFDLRLNTHSKGEEGPAGGEDSDGEHCASFGFTSRPAAG